MRAVQRWGLENVLDTLKHLNTINPYLILIIIKKDNLTISCTVSKQS